jgi:hypothetical protein
MPEDEMTQWAVVCRTEDAWNELAARFKKSRNPDEKVRTAGWRRHALDACGTIDKVQA